MDRRSFIPVLLFVVAGAMGLAWWLLQADSSRTVASNEIATDGSVADSAAPLELPAGNRVVEPKPEHEPKKNDNATDATPATTETETPDPNLHAPDYGPAINRGGGVVNFELFDAAGWRVPLSMYSGKLWRRVGDFWVFENLRINRSDNVVRCDGLGASNVAPAGLEPGEYELELMSGTMGNIRHTFGVSKGEVRTDRLLTPLYRRTVAVRFVDQNAAPVSHIPSVPVVTVNPPALDEKPRATREHLELRSSPLEPLPLRGGMGWASSGRPHHRRSSKRLYATDDGRWWVYVYAGAKNTIRFNLDANVWGQESAEIVGDFTTGEEFTVRLNLPDDFAAAVEQWGNVSSHPAGNGGIVAPPSPKANDEFDPYTSPVKGRLTRVIVEVDSPVALTLEVSMSKEGEPHKPWRTFKQLGNVYWYDLGDFAEFAWRASDGDLYMTDWKPIDIHGSRVVTLKHVVDAPFVSLALDDLSPTLRAFAHELDVGLATVQKLQPDSDDVEGPAPKEGEALTSGRFKAPAGLTMLNTITMIAGAHPGTFAGGHRVNSTDIADGLLVRTELRGVARMRQRRNGGAGYGPDGRTVYDPVVLRGGWEPVDPAGQSLAALLEGGLLRPRIGDVFAARAVGPRQEGLPWVSGVVLDYEDDELAHQVRFLSRGLSKDGARPYISRSGLSDYADDYAAASAEPTEAGLRGLLDDDVYDAFDTDEQRLWYARHNAWYDTSRRFYSDEHGYIMKQQPGLEPNGVYVLYLWSNSRDDLYPDARVVFKVDEDGVADLGAIHLPTFTD